MNDEEFIKIRREIEAMTIDEIRDKFNLGEMDSSELRMLDQDPWTFHPWANLRNKWFGSFDSKWR